MRTCPCPDGSRLPERHRPFFFRLLKTLIDNGFRQGKLQPLLPAIAADFDALSPTDEELFSWCEELRLWVCWYRVPAYWLTFIFQSRTQARGSGHHFLACELYSDAQTHFADDLALSSLETAYSAYLRNAATLGPAFDFVKSDLERKLKDYLDDLAAWSRPFAFHECNPIADHRYTRLSLAWLGEAVAVEARATLASDASALAELVACAGNDDLAYYSIVAGRFLGLLHASRGEHEASVLQFQRALEQARARRLDTEIGHLRRLLGSALRACGRLDEAKHQFEQALAFERLEPFFAYTFYWQALSARELGDTLLQMSGTADNAEPGGPGHHRVLAPDLEKLKPALSAYHDGRLHFGGHMSFQCPFPLARAAKQQIFRSFSTNAIQVAGLLQSPKDVLAEVEWAGPREATELVTEMAAASSAGLPDAGAFRRNRALFFETLNTAPQSFEAYLANISAYGAARRAYLQQSIALDAHLTRLQGCDDIVERACALRLPNTVFLLFHVGPVASTMVLFDLSSGLAAPFDLAFGETQLREIHAEYESLRRAAADAATQNRALAALLSRYEALLTPTLEPILRFLPGRHLKIFPRLQMNAVPFHALRLQGKPLIEHCAAVSYGQTLGLFLANHGSPTARCESALRFVIGDRVPWYRLLLPALRKTYGDSLQEEPQPPWDRLLASVAARPARDTVFACHGGFDPDSVANSRLELADGQPDGRVSFSRVFEQLDLRGCRSVFMGSCESGMARTDVAAEYIGLPAAMLSSGVRYVVGALWKIPQAASAVFVDRFLRAVNSDDADLCLALAQVQRDMIRMRREELLDWVRSAMRGDPALERVLKSVAALGELPFAEPYQWAGLHVMGDV